MFFLISGVNTKSKDIGSVPNVICPNCGALSNMRVAVLYESLHLFYIPTFKWHRRYLVSEPICGAVFALDSEQGLAIEKGKISTIDPSHLHKVSGFSSTKDTCKTCGAELPPGAKYCAQCGNQVL